MFKISFLLFLFMSFFCFSQQSINYESLNEDLELAFDRDQSIRRLIRKENSDPNNIKNMMKIDSLNQLIVFEILDNHGWLKPPSVTRKASKAFFYIIQHSNLDSQLKYKKYIDSAYLDNIISPIEFAMFSDRVLLKQNKFQLYGTQTYTSPTGRVYFPPIQEINELDERRKKIGLKPLRFELNLEHELLNINIEDFVVMIHLIDQQSNIPCANVEIYENNKLMGKSNNEGFFQFITTLKNDTSIKLKYKGIEKTISINKKNNFIDLYFYI